jgi:pSer/pThr/pTyr-binding forkhead associated (FHA) protein
MKASLIERGVSSDDVREFPIDKPEFLIGRGADCDLRLRISSVSRHHCLIHVSADEATVVDLGSSNGTFVNDKRIRSQTALQTGDLLRVGNRQFTVDLGDQPADPSATTARETIALTVRLPTNNAQAKP